MKALPDMQESQRSPLRTQIVFRPLTPADEPFLWEMLFQALYVQEGEPPFPRTVLQEPDIRRYVEGWGREHDAGLLALVDGAPAGAAWLRLLAGENRGFGYVDEQTPELSIALLPERRRQGIGSLLLGEIIVTARSRYRAICLSVVAENPAVRLYRRFGFEVFSSCSDSLTMVLRFD